MNKLLTKIVGAALGASMAVGVGVGVAINNDRKEINSEVHAADGSVSKSADTLATENSWTQSAGTIIGTKFSSFNLDDYITVSFAGTGNTATYWTDVRIYGTKSKSDASVTFTGAAGVTIKTITLTYSTQNSPSFSPSISSENALTVNSNSQTITMTSGSKNGQMRITNFACTYTYTPASTPATGISLSSANFTPVDGVITIEKDSGDDEDILTATVTPNDATDKTVAWSSDNESVAQVEDGLVVIDTSAVGEATITASANGGTNVTATMTYSVVNSSAVQYNVSVTATNGSYLPASPTIYENSSTTITFSANSGYKLPTSSSAFTVTNATLDSWDSSNGQLVIKNPTSAPSVSVSMVALSTYTISVTNNNCTYTGASSIQEGGSATITFTANAGYALPATVTSLSGATQTSWDNSTGVLIIGNPTGNVSITMTAAAYTNTPNLTPGKYFISYSGHYFTGSISGGKGASDTTIPSDTDAAKFTFSLVGNDTWTIKNDEDKYLGIGSSSTSLSLSNSVTNLTVESGSSSGTYKIRVPDGRYMAYYSSGSDFRTYNSGQSGAYYDFTLTVAKTISGFSVDTTNADKNVLKGTEFNATAAAAAGFQARLNYSDSTFDDVTSLATWELNTATTGTKTLTVTYSSYDPVLITDINVYSVVIKTLTVDASEAKTAYVEGEQLNTADLVITGYEQDSTPHTLAIGECTFSPANGATLSTSDTSVTVTYTNEDSSKATTTYSITVSAFAGYSKVTAASDITVGDSYVIGAIAGTNLMGAYASNNGKHYRQVVDGSSVVNNEYTKVSSLPSGAVEITFLSDGNGGYYIYDITSDAYLQSSSSTATLKNVSSISSATVWTISFDETGIQIVDENSHYLEYNSQTPRFSNYAYNSSNYIALYKKNGSAVKTEVTSFANNSLKMNDPAYEGDITTANCKSNYSAMKSAYVALSDAEKNVFQYSDDYSAARARLQKWAAANHETFTYGNENPFAASSGLSPLNVDNSVVTTVVIVISVLTLTTLGGYFLLRKRKEEN